MDTKPPILVVEDETVLATGLCDVLAFRGYAPTAVGSGEDGLRRAITGRYALVLLDVMLPGLSGFDVCRELRTRRPEQPILLLTARGAEGDVLAGFRSGADDYVTKPFSIAELMARIEALLRRAGRLAATDSRPFELGRTSPRSPSDSRGSSTTCSSSRASRKAHVGPSSRSASSGPL